MPTHDELEPFLRDFDRLSVEAKRALVRAIRAFTEDLQNLESGEGSSVRGSLRVKPLQGWPGVWELTWDGNDGRATFEYGPEVKPGARHVVWRRCGSHRILKNP